MIGDVVRRPQIVDGTKISTKFRDYILENWTEKRSGVPVSTANCESRYDEYWFNASSLHKLCPRMCAIACATKVSLAEVFRPEALWLFGIGRAYHQMFQREIMTTWDNDVFQGSWERYVREDSKNLLGEHIWRRDFITGEQVRAKNIERGWCPRPKTKGWRIEPNWKYIEPKARDYEYRLVCKADGILVWPDSPAEVWELKTEKVDALETLDPFLGGKPRPTHVVQVQAMMWQFNLTLARIFYVGKGAKSFGSGTIEHVVERDEDVIGGIKATLKECLGSISAVEEAEREVVNLVEGGHIAAQDGEISVQGNDGVELTEDQQKASDAIVERIIPGRLAECTKRTDPMAKNCVCKDACMPKRAKAKKKK